MNLTFRGFGRIALFAAGTVAFTACSNMPLGQSTSEMSSTSAVKATSSIIMPVALPDNPRPSYPAAELKDGLSEMVYVACLVNEKGEVVQAHIQKSTHPAFNRPTLDAVKHWKFQPGTKDGVPTQMFVVVPVEFQAQRLAGA